MTGSSSASFRWNRHALTLTIASVLGLLTNLLVAWGCALRDEPTVGTAFFDAESRRALDRYDALGVTLVYCEVEHDGNPIVTELPAPAFAAHIGPEIGNPGARLVATKAAGLPWPAFRFDIEQTGNTDPYETDYSFFSDRDQRVIRGGWNITTLTGPRTTQALTDAVALPLIPVWPGVVANTLAYAVALWGATIALTLAGRRFVRAPYQCKACGYDLRGLAGLTCPECGRPAPGTPPA